MDLQGNITTAFEALRHNAPVSARGFHAVSLGTRPRHWIAISSDRRPTFLIESSEPQGPVPSIAVSNLEFHPHRSCQFEELGYAPIATNVNVVKCMSDSEDMQRCFLMVVGSVCMGVQSSEPSILFESLNALSAFFRSAQIAPRKSNQGLWSELCVIHSFEDRPRGVLAWHAKVRAIHDFEFPRGALEVKSSISGRTHRFKAIQLEAHGKAKVLVLSMLVSPDESGKSTFELWSAVDQELERLGAQELRLKLTRLVSESVGSNWKEAMTAKYSPERARQSVLVIESTQVPRPESEDPRVTDIEFSADLGSCSAVVRGLQAIRVIESALL